MFSDGLAVSKGVGDQAGTRNTPSLLNVAFSTDLFWDGRRSSLEQQALDPLLNPREHGLKGVDAILAAVRSNAFYLDAFHREFPHASEPITLDHVLTAIATFERTLLAGGSAFDRYEYRSEKTALTDAAKRGLEIFRGRAQCAKCHVIREKHALFTDGQFHSLGVGMKAIESRLPSITNNVVSIPASQLDQLISQNQEVAALGQFVLTKQPRDIGKFRTPSLRNVAMTAPYMHDGSARTLEDAVDMEVYYRSLEANTPLILTPAEEKDLIAFLASLTSPMATHNN